VLRARLYLDVVGVLRLNPACLEVLQDPIPPSVSAFPGITVQALAPSAPL